MPNRTVPAAATGLPKSRRAAKPLLRFAIPLPPGFSVRDALAAKIQTLIDCLDRMDPDPDLEPSLGGYNGPPANYDLEADNADDEPTLGALGHMNQMRWSAGENGRDDAEVDDSDQEDAADDEDDGTRELSGDEDEPSLGAPEGLDQTRWSQGNQVGTDIEKDVRVPGKPRRKLLGYPGEIYRIERAEASRVSGELRAIVARRPDAGGAAVRP